MDHATYNRIKEDLRAKADGIETSKRPAYTIGSSDVLANFKRVAERSNTTPMQTCLVYLLKHIDSISSLVQHGEISQAEPVSGRFADAINYLHLLFALFCEDATNHQKEKGKEENE